MERAQRRLGGAALISIIVVLFALAADPAHAAINVAPVVHEVYLDSGATSSGTWGVRNMTDHPMRITVQAVAYEDYIRGRPDAAAPEWIRISPVALTLEPGGETLVSYEAALPRERDGEAMAFVFFEEIGSAMVQGRIGTAFYVLDRAALHPQLALSTIRLVDDGRGGKRFFMELANRGNVHVRPSGTVEIVDSAGAVAASAALREGMPVLPHGRDRFVTESLDRMPPPGDYRARWALSPGLIDTAPGPVLEGETALRIDSH